MKIANFCQQVIKLPGFYVQVFTVVSNVKTFFFSTPHLKYVQISTYLSRITLPMKQTSHTDHLPEMEHVVLD